MKENKIKPEAKHTTIKTRRRWTTEQKLKILDEVVKGSTDKGIRRTAKRHSLTPVQLRGWIKQKEALKESDNVSHWVKESWHSIESKIIVKSFYTCLKTVSGSTDDEEVSDSDDDQEEDNEEDGEEDGEDEIEIIEEENYVF
eukprot:TRINITY_DN4584_c0_g1_i6.p1 TRINITY_DN4584_c0_g1~~TRINITY_DN4584_c0_g1_i6.p1  ORF type:complete len:164 (-),score=29.39 TRINITY_DN4584_c0_g1_i6:4-429(-)